MEDREILDCIRGLVAQEHHLREARDRGELSEDVETSRLAELEDSLDQMWDLLRRRRAMRTAGLDPDSAEQQPILLVRNYMQ